MISDINTYPDFGGITALVADDTQINYILLNKMLEKINIRTIWAQDGKHCVDLLAQHPEVQLILMDVQMPVMDGIEAAGIVHLQKPELPIIFQTAFGLHGDQERIASLGFGRYISKPVDRMKLYALISDLLK